MHLQLGTGLRPQKVPQLLVVHLQQAGHDPDLLGGSQFSRQPARNEGGLAVEDEQTHRLDTQSPMSDLLQRGLPAVSQPRHCSVAWPGGLGQGPRQQGRWPWCAALIVHAAGQVAALCSTYWKR